MKSIQLKAIGTTDDKRRYYILVKEKSVEEPLNKIMERIGSGILYYGEGNSPAEYENHVENVISGKYDIDIVYTSNRIIIIVRAPKEQQEFFKSLLLEYSKFEKK